VISFESVSKVYPDGTHAVEVMERPQHPYTRTLLSAIPRIER